MMDHIANNLKDIRRQLARHSQRPITLIGVSKGQSSDKIIAGAKAGLIDFGENKLQEIEQKWPKIKTSHPKLILHFIGNVQSKKLATICKYANFIHSIDRIKLIDMMQHYPNTHYFLQINIGNEPQKSGIALAEADEIIAHAKTQKHSPIGLMCLPPAGKPATPFFETLAKLAKKHDLPQLSMGMSADYAEALTAGATHIRVGTALFGNRHNI